jgi:C1A family cysteine protease
MLESFQRGITMGNTLIGRIGSLFSSGPINNPTTIINAPLEKLASMKINFGYKEHNDEATNISKANISFSASPLASAPLVEGISVKQNFKDISNQYSVGSCVANSTADNGEAELARSKKISPSQVEDLSRLFIYWNSRNNQSPPAADVDDGTYISLAFDSVRRYGVPAETTWPYNIGDVNKRPSPIAYKRAIANRLIAYYSINSDGDARVAEVIRALSSGHGVVIGTKVDTAFTKLNSTNYVATVPTGNYIGGHAMVVVGWNNNMFEVRNSWGTGWGNQGYFLMSPEYIKASITHDLFVMTL